MLHPLRREGAPRCSWCMAPLLALVSASCLTPASAPVPVQGSPDAMAVMSGEWSGRYWSKDTGRHGLISFVLPERGDSGYGEVEITFSPTLHLLQEATAENELDGKTCTHIDISVVRVEGAGVRGTMVPYWDPDCDCRATTEFEGKVTGDRITGTFTTRRASSDRRVLLGQWEATRR